MFHANARTAQVLEVLVAGLAHGESHKIDNSSGAYMALSVEHLHGNHYSTTHYFEQNGDLVPDPDVEWWRAPQNGSWFPVAIQHSTGQYVRVIHFGEDGHPVSFHPAAQRDLVAFCNLWIGQNIPDQQGGLDTIRTMIASQQK